MCGIIASVGDINHYQVILEGLKRLEYRGYDSSGISYLDETGINIIKVPSSIDSLLLKVNRYHAFNSLGHTRWATHGKISYENTHPFLSMKGLFSLVHNGTITNYLSLKEELIEKGYTFQGQTDSEVVVNYLEYLFLENKDVLLSLSLLDLKLVGSYSLVINHLYDRSLYFLKNQTPLLVIKKENGYVISSDLYGINDNEFSYLEVLDHQYGKVDTSLEIYQNRELITHRFIVEKSTDEESNHHSCFLEKEIYECPTVLKETINYYSLDSNIPIEVKTLLTLANRIIIIACGTSFNAGLIFKRLVRDKQVEVILASEFIYSSFNVREDDAYIFISQSGETLDVIKAIKLVNKNTISITNSSLSTIKRLTKYHFDIKVKKEVSVASTKAYFGEVVLLYYLADLINKLDRNALMMLPYYMNLILQREKEIHNIALEISKYQSLYFLGKGIDFDVAKECSLKLKEITYIHSEEIYMGELKHGPLALINDNFPCIIINSSTLLDEVVNNSIEEIKARKGKIFTFNVDNNYSLSFLLQVYFGDLLALHVGRIKGVNIDKPRNLAKSVTVE